MKLYELLVDGFHTPLTATQIGELYRAGRLRRNDPCRELGTDRWRTVDEVFPLLKYDQSESVSLVPIRRSSSVLQRSDYEGAEPLPASTTALKAGWVCFGIGLSISWFFPFGNVFLSIALISAVVAMCTHQVNRGLALLISSFCAMLLCAVVFFVLAVGTVAVAGSAAADKLKRDMDRQRAAQQARLAQLNRSAAQLQSSFQSLTPPAPTSQQSAVTRAYPPASAAPAPLQRAPMPQAQSNPPVFQSQPSRTTADAVRQAEMQRDRINAKEQRVEQLDRSISNLDHLIQQMRGYGWNESMFVKQRDQLVKEKWDLQH